MLQGAPGDGSCRPCPAARRAPVPEPTPGFPSGAGLHYQSCFTPGGRHSQRNNHHLAWAGVGAPTPPENALGLRHFTIRLPREAELARVLERLHGAGVAVERIDEGLLTRDPSRNGILLTAATTE
ncbi:MAG: hypothetical protein M1389_02165 [Chloroflexi bacterium]|nr:hypothetical protein [Chloroflexota bacterium]